MPQSDGPRFVIAESMSATNARPWACTKARALEPSSELAPGLPSQCFALSHELLDLGVVAILSRGMGLEKAFKSRQKESSLIAALRTIL